MSQCKGTSWGGHGKRPYGPGNYNRCVLEVDHPGSHTDDWGHVFVMGDGKHTPRIRVLTRVDPAQIKERIVPSGCSLLDDEDPMETTIEAQLRIINEYEARILTEATAALITVHAQEFEQMMADIRANILVGL